MAHGNFKLVNLGIASSIVIASEATSKLAKPAGGVWGVRSWEFYAYVGLLLSWYLS